MRNLGSYEGTIPVLNCVFLPNFYANWGIPRKPMRPTIEVLTSLKHNTVVLVQTRLNITSKPSRTDCKLPYGILTLGESPPNAISHKRLQMI